jgi:quinol monooxygenase YgiN
MSVRDGRLNDARELMGEMVTSTRKEAGAQGYEWFLTARGGGAHLPERLSVRSKPWSGQSSNLPPF